MRDDEYCDWYQEQLSLVQGADNSFSSIQKRLYCFEARPHTQFAYP